MSFKKILQKLQLDCPLPNPKCHYTIHFCPKRDALVLSFVADRPYESVLNGQEEGEPDEFLTKIISQVQDVLKNGQRETESEAELRKAVYEISDEVYAERKRQEAKWGQQNHFPIEWCAILGEEVGEVQKEALEHHFNYKNVKSHPKVCEQKLMLLRKELTQVAAVAFSMIESLDRNELKRCREGIKKV